MEVLFLRSCVLSRSIGDILGKIIEDIRHKVVEQPWFGQIVTPSHGGHELTMPESLGWEVPGLQVKPEYRPNIDLDKFFRGSEVAQDRETSLETERNNLHREQDCDRDR
jgi:hypothetical protein